MAKHRVAKEIDKTTKANASSPPGARDDTYLIALGLTPRECEVMWWVSEGKRNREIAVILGLSSRTVEEHVAHIFRKLQVKTRTAAACKCRYSIEWDGTAPVAAWWFQGCEE